jgi:competence protein ComEC
MEDTLGNVLLLDAGVDRRGVLRDYLRSRGIHRVDVVIVTHPDRDHFGGLLDLEERVRLGTLLVPTRTRGDSGYERLLARLEAQGTRVVVAGSGTDVTGLGFGLRVLWPDPVTRGLYEAGLMSTNPVSLVALLEYRGFRMLLPGDLDEPEAIAELGVTAELLKSPHHGSRKGNPQRLFDAVRPQQLVVMGRYPTPARLEERLARPPPVYVNTRRDGGCVLRFRGARPVWQRSLAPR